ncbi:MAG TPA: pyruvate, phosphate dikinase [Nocardioidaceae bacterium]|nr:pyruvate, phosphate dikinase [Nocardioidaceae bacterium]
MSMNSGDATKFVYDFAEGGKAMLDLLGGKGANLAEMSNLGLPVPPGFTITTEACRAYLEQGAAPPSLDAEIADHLMALEQRMDKRLGDPHDPLLVSVRSGAKFSMPGMMETVLNVGLNDRSVVGLGEQSGSARFAWDSYRRLVQMFGQTVLGIDGDAFEEAIEARKQAVGTSDDLDLDTDALRALVGDFKQIVKDRAGRDFPQDPREQLDLATSAVFGSWNAERAVLYRRQERIPADLGTAVNVVAMVFGNLGDDSGTGVCFTRDPASGAQGIYGDYLPNAQGEDVVAGVRNTLALAELEHLDKRSYDQLLKIMTQLERHYLDLCDIEFTIERGTLWMLQTRVGKRTAGAAFVVAMQLCDEGLIDLDEALTRVSGSQLAQLMFPRFAPGTDAPLLSSGIGASPGAASGEVVFDSQRAKEWSTQGRSVILVRRETNPDDLPGMIAARGVLTSRGGKTSHAAVVARGMGKTCVCGAEQLSVDAARRRITAGDGRVVQEGDVLSIDGTTGEVFVGEVEVESSLVVRYFEGELDAGAPEADELVRAVDRLMRHADERRRLGVRTNADTAQDCGRGRRFGAEGVGLCRTEHMFLGERRKHVEELILAADDAGRDAALSRLAAPQREDFEQILAAMDGQPVTIRLIDPPLHEFLPDLTDLAVEVALAEERGEDAGEEAIRARELLAAVRRLHEQNPMLGLRGVRLGLVVEGLFGMQVRAVAEATALLVQQGKAPRPEIMVPLVATVQELQLARDQIAQVLAEVAQASGVDLPCLVGTMIELPRAALTAGEIAEHADFFSFGTNDLTQMTWGFSRDDVEAAFFPAYLERGIFGVSPFETIDAEGVGELVRVAAEAGRAAHPGLKLGICGEHGADPDSVHFFHRIGLDYVSCSPFRVPVARLEAGRAAVADG